MKGEYMSERHVGKVIQVMGPVLDIRFQEGQLPELLNAIEIENQGSRVIAEVAQQIGDDVVRCIAMNSTDGMVRGVDAVDTGAPISVPVGDACLGRVFNLLGDPVDKKPAPQNAERWSIHRQAPSYEEQMPTTEILETGIKVVDFSKWLPGQYCGMLLGDYGADVIKIEDLQGDATRRFWPEKTKGMSYWHLMLNRNKRGVALNLKKDGGRDLLLKLLQEADVFLEGFRPGYLARYGLDYTSVHKINPRLVYCSITGFGQESHKPAHDLNVVGLAGLNNLDDVGRACVSEVQVSAVGSGLNALSAISMALLARERTGKGQWLDVNLYATALSMQVTGISALWGCRETGEKPFGRIAHYYNIYRTADGRYMTVGTIEPKFWQRFCDLIECPELEKRQYDFAHEEELQQLVAAKIAAKTQQEWLELIGGAEFCVTPVCSLEEALDSKLTAQEYILQEADSDLGRLQYIGGPVKFSEDASTIRMRAPKLGEHTLDILQELGYNDNEISALHEEGAI